MPTKNVTAAVPQACEDQRSNPPPNRTRNSPTTIATPAIEPGPATRDLHPDEDESPEGSESLANDVIRGAGARQSARQLGERQRATERDTASEGPQQVDLPCGVCHRRELAWCEEDTRAEHVADDDSRHGPEAKDPPQL